MRSRRTAGTSQYSELEMLQTDIMRFMAIIALCLLAIFAMVQSLGEVAEVPPGALPVEPTPVESIQPTPDEPFAVADPVPAPAPDPVPPAPARKPKPLEPQGFTLRFADDTAFMTLLRQGRVALQVRRHDTTWHWRGGRFEAGGISGDFYQLELETVPGSLREQLAHLASLAESRWLVSLPADTRRQLDAMMAQHRGGALVIDAFGQVSHQ